jgi:DNA-binding SARP family transcriptional activator
MPHLSLSLLGSFQVVLDDQPITELKSDKARALLAYLSVEAEQTHRCDRLAGLLWPDWPDANARANLRHALNTLRTVFRIAMLLAPFSSATGRPFALTLTATMSSM